jgi:hypothetical protein
MNSIMRIVILVSVLLLGMTSCKPFPPDRLQNVSDKAFWVEYENIGQWFLIEDISKDTQTIHCKIYDSKSEKILVDKDFALICSGAENAIDWSNLEDEIRYYNTRLQFISLKTNDWHGKYCTFEFK